MLLHFLFQKLFILQIITSYHVDKNQFLFYVFECIFATETCKASRKKNVDYFG